MLAATVGYDLTNIMVYGGWRDHAMGWPYGDTPQPSTITCFGDSSLTVFGDIQPAGSFRKVKHEKFQTPGMNLELFRKQQRLLIALRQP